MQNHVKLAHSPVRSLLSFSVLMGFYVLLSGQLHSAYLMIVGALCCLAVVFFMRHLRILDKESMPFEHWSRTLAYGPWLLWQILVSNLDVARRVWSLDPHIEPQLTKLPHQLKSAYGLATYANSITLTPGTVTVEIADDHLLIHALTQQAAQDLHDGEMHRRVLQLEEAVTPPQLPGDTP